MRVHFAPRYFSTPGYYAPSVGVWDLYFLSRASDLFWYHHWNDRAIRRALYQDKLLQDGELRRLEERVRTLESQQVARNPDYLPPDVEPEELYSEDHLEELYASRRERESGWGFGLLLSLFVGCLFIYFFFIRRYSTR